MQRKEAKAYVRHIEYQIVKTIKTSKGDKVTERNFAVNLYKKLGTNSDEIILQEGDEGDGLKINIQDYHSENLSAMTLKNFVGSVTNTDVAFKYITKSNDKKASTLVFLSHGYEISNNSLMSDSGNHNHAYVVDFNEKLDNSPFEHRTEGTITYEQYIKSLKEGNFFNSKLKNTFLFPHDDNWVQRHTEQITEAVNNLDIDVYILNEITGEVPTSLMSVLESLDIQQYAKILVFTCRSEVGKGKGDFGLGNPLAKSKFAELEKTYE
ncbi:butyrate kinase [Acrasis kona]|uniref:Butyrate kinase n=1 Tax=Acrasis kona TaxID=1008807 RepID=A0AAW2YVR2_9EUKA